MVQGGARGLLLRVATTQMPGAEPKNGMHFLIIKRVPVPNYTPLFPLSRQGQNDDGSSQILGLQRRPVKEPSIRSELANHFGPCFCCARRIISDHPFRGHCASRAPLEAPKSAPFTGSLPSCRVIFLPLSLPVADRIPFLLPSSLLRVCVVMECQLVA
jgi:hypothetical protein